MKVRVKKEIPKGKVDGKCGYQAGKVMFYSPVGMCDEGEYKIGGTGWSCLGYNGGSNVECSAITGVVNPDPGDIIYDGTNIPEIQENIFK